MIDNSEKFCLFLTEKHLKMLFLYVFSLASCFATLALCFVHWLPVLLGLGFLRQFPNVEKTKNLYRPTGFWGTRAIALVNPKNRFGDTDY